MHCAVVEVFDVVAEIDFDECCCCCCCYLIHFYLTMVDYCFVAVAYCEAVVGLCYALSFHYYCVPSFLPLWCQII